MSFLSAKALKRKTRSRLETHIGFTDIEEKAIKERTQFDSEPTFNLKVACILEFISEQLRERKASPLQIEGYRRGATIVRQRPVSLENMTHDELLTIAGFGDGLARLVIEVARTGSCRLYKRCLRPIREQPDEF